MSHPKNNINLLKITVAYSICSETIHKALEVVPLIRLSVMIFVSFRLKPAEPFDRSRS